MLIQTETETVEVHIMDYGSEEAQRLMDQMTKGTETYKGYMVGRSIEPYSMTTVKVTVTYRK